MFGHTSVIDDNVALPGLALVRPCPAYMGTPKEHLDAVGRLSSVIPQMAALRRRCRPPAESSALRPVCSPEAGIKWTAGLGRRLSAARGSVPVGQPFCFTAAGFSAKRRDTEPPGWFPVRFDQKKRHSF